MLLRFLCKAKTRKEDYVSWIEINGGIAMYFFFFNMTTKHEAVELPFKILRAVSGRISIPAGLKSCF